MERERGHTEVAALIRERAGKDTGWASGPPEDGPLAERVTTLLSNGLTLDAAVDIALLNSPALQLTYEELGISQADMVQAGLLSNPQLGGSFGLPEAQGIIEYEAALAFNFLDLFALPLRKRVAKEQFQSDILRVAHEALETIAQARKAFLAAQAEAQRVELGALALRAAEAAAELATRQREAGNITELALATELASLEEAKLQHARDEVLLLELREQLNRLLGLWGKNTGWHLSQPLPALPADEPELSALEARAIRQRLDVDALRKQTLLLHNAVELARSTRMFGIFEVGIHVHQDPDGPRLLGPTLALELPLFDQRQATIGKLDAQLRQAQRRLDGVAIQVRSEVRLAQAQLRVARLSAEHLRDRLLPLRERALAATQLQYNGMQVGLKELVAAKQAQLEASRSYALALRDYWSARAELDRVLGGQLTAAPPTPSTRSSP